MIGFARTCLTLLFVIAAVSVAHAQDKPPPTPAERCLQARQPIGTATTSVSIVVNPATRWQPRGGTIIVAATDTNAAIRTTQIIACIGWNLASNELWTLASVNVRQPESTDKPYTTNLGIIVPDLEDTSQDYSTRINRQGVADFFGIVPNARLRLIGLNDQKVVFDVDQTVGITSHWLSYIVTLAVVGLSLLVVLRLSKQVPPPKAPGKLGWILDVIKVRDGSASLSSLQMLLWTILVIGCAAYVMSLSGTLINITNGMLTLLGIAGGTRLVAAYTESNTAVPPMPITAPPQWSDLVRADATAAVDITRIQMLLFTLVSAWFVTLVVVTTYVIPDIPSGYVVLMGISNGVYAGRKLTS